MDELVKDNERWLFRLLSESRNYSDATQEVMTTDWAVVYADYAALHSLDVRSLTTAQRRGAIFDYTIAKLK